MIEHRVHDEQRPRPRPVIGASRQPLAARKALENGGGQQQQLEEREIGAEQPSKPRRARRGSSRDRGRPARRPSAHRPTTTTPFAGATSTSPRRRPSQVSRGCPGATPGRAAAPASATAGRNASLVALRLPDHWLWDFWFRPRRRRPPHLLPAGTPRTGRPRATPPRRDDRPRRARTTPRWTCCRTRSHRSTGAWDEHATWTGGVTRHGGHWHISTPASRAPTRGETIGVADFARPVGERTRRTSWCTKPSARWY